MQNALKGEVNSSQPSKGSLIWGQVQKILKGKQETKFKSTFAAGMAFSTFDEVEVTGD